MRKVDDGKKEKKRKKIMLFIVATNIVASQPPTRRPTGTRHTLANICSHVIFVVRTITNMQLFQCVMLLYIRKKMSDVL